MLLILLLTLILPQKQTQIKRPRRGAHQFQRTEGRLRQGYGERRQALVNEFRTVDWKTVGLELERLEPILVG
jgi:hypothetical protein